MTNHTLAPFPFFHQIDESERVVDERMDDLAEEEKLQDVEDVKYMKDYRRNSGWDQKAKRGQKIYNVVQTMTPEDEVSRIFLGTVRTMIDRGIEQMTEGEPDFSFEPFGPSDHMKTIIWKHMIKQIMSKCEYKMHQELFFRDYFVMGSGVFQIYIDYPKRTLRIPNPAMEGGFEEVVTLDHRRPKVGVRAVNPLDCWRNPRTRHKSRLVSDVESSHGINSLKSTVGVLMTMERIAMRTWTRSAKVPMSVSIPTRMRLGIFVVCMLGLLEINPMVFHSIHCLKTISVSESSMNHSKYMKRKRMES
jgi:hypothetical protein